MRPLRWLLVIAVICGFLSTPEPLRMRVQQARIAMTRLGLMLVYADFGA